MQAQETAPGNTRRAFRHQGRESFVRAGGATVYADPLDPGARVIKIEMPDGDETGAYFIGINRNRNKRELVLESHPARVARDTGPPA